MTRTVLLAALSALVSLAADAQTYPNRAVRGGTLGAEAGARAAPDGYTRDLVPVTMLARSPNVFIVHAASRFPVSKS